MSDILDGRDLDPLASTSFDRGMLESEAYDQMRGQLLSSVEGSAAGLGLNLDQLMADQQYLDPHQPMVDFANQWQDADGNWLGDPRQLYQHYLSALCESFALSVASLADAYMQAAMEPPWANPDAVPLLDGPETDDRFPWPEPTQEPVPPGYWEETTPYGEDVFVSGLDPYWQQANLDWAQGDEVPGFQGTCGLTSVANVANMFGIPLTEADVIDFAARNGLCVANSFDPDMNGNTILGTQDQLLDAAGIPAHAEWGRGLDDLASYIDQDRGVIVEVNAGELWGDYASYGGGGANHAITLTGVVRDADGEVQGFYVCDSGRGEPSDVRRFVSADLMQRCWGDVGGCCVVTDVQRTQGYPPQYA